MKLKFTLFFIITYLQIFGQSGKELLLYEQREVEIALNNLTFKPNSDMIESGQESSIALIKNKLGEMAIINYIDIIDVAKSDVYTQKELQLSKKRTQKIKELLVNSLLIKKDLIETISKNEVVGCAGYQNNIVKIIINYTQKKSIKVASDVPESIVKIDKSICNKPTNKSKDNSLAYINNSNQPTVKKIKVENKFYMPINLKEPDVVIISVIDQSKKEVNHFSKKIEKRGKAIIEVPKDNLKSGLYTVKMVSLNGALAIGNMLVVD